MYLKKNWNLTPPSVFLAGGGGIHPPQTDIANYAYFCLGNMFFLLFDFLYNRDRHFLVKKKFKKNLGKPPFGPLKNQKISKFSKVTPHDLL